LSFVEVEMCWGFVMFVCIITDTGIASMASIHHGSVDQPIKG